MTSPRLSLALEGGLTLPDTGRIAVLAPRAGMDLSALPLDRCHVITGLRPDHDYFAGLGFACDTAPEGRYGAVLVSMTRARAEARALVAQAVSITDGPVIVDGVKTDGIESALKDIRKRLAITGPVNKAHGKLFWFTSTDCFDDWHTGPSARIDGGFVTAPGVFSADGVDPASAYLADHLPDRIGAHVADLGAGWGYLSARAVSRPDIVRIDLVEANHAALACARQNVLDPRAQFHWDDVLRWTPETSVDAVIMNPPFHSGRTADPGLGRAFIDAARRVMKPQGQLWMIANRHLPYERTLAAHFSDVSEIAGDTKFKLLHARRPTRQRRESVLA